MITKVRIVSWLHKHFLKEGFQKGNNATQARNHPESIKLLAVIIAIAEPSMAFQETMVGIFTIEKPLPTTWAGKGFIEGELFYCF